MGILAGWFALSVPVGLLVGRLFAARDRDVLIVPALLPDTSTRAAA